MLKFLGIVATLPLLVITELPQKGGHSSGSYGGSVSASSQYSTPVYGSGSSGGFGGYQSSHQTAQGFELKGQSAYNTGNYRQNGIGGYSNKEGHNSGGGGGYNVGSDINGFSHGGNGNGFGHSGSFGHSTEIGSGLQSIYGAHGSGSSSHLGSINLQRFPDFTSSLESMSSFGAPKLASSYPMIGHFGYGSPLLHNSGLDLGTLMKFGSWPTQVSGGQRQGSPELHGLSLTIPSTKYGFPSTNLPSSIYGATPGSSSQNNDASSFGSTYSYGVPFYWPSIKVYGVSAGDQSSMYGAPLLRLTSTFGETSAIPSFKKSKPTLDLTTLGGFANLYSVPSNIYGTTSGVATSGKPSLSFYGPSSGMSSLYDTPSSVHHAPSNSLFNTHDSSPQSPSSTHGARWTPLNGPSPSYGALSGSSNEFSIAPKGLHAPSTGLSTAYGAPSAALSVYPDRYGMPSNVLTTPSGGQSTHYGVPSHGYY